MPGAASHSISRCLRLLNPLIVGGKVNIVSRERILGSEMSCWRK